MVDSNAIFASRESFRIEERNDFYVAPYAIIAMLALAVPGVVPRTPRALIPAGLAAGILPVIVRPILMPSDVEVPFA